MHNLIGYPFSLTYFKVIVMITRSLTGIGIQRER